MRIGSERRRLTGQNLRRLFGGRIDPSMSEGVCFGSDRLRSLGGFHCEQVEIILAFFFLFARIVIGFMGFKLRFMRFKFRFVSQLRTLIGMIFGSCFDGLCFLMLGFGKLLGKRGSFVIAQRALEMERSRFFVMIAVFVRVFRGIVFDRAFVLVGAGRFRGARLPVHLVFLVHHLGGRGHVMPLGIQGRGKVAAVRLRCSREAARGSVGSQLRAGLLATFRLAGCS